MVDPVTPVVEPVEPDPVVDPPFTDEKVWWKSRGIVGAVIAGASGIISLVSGHVVTAQDQTLFTTDALNLINAVSSIVTVVASLVAWWGRKKAHKKISNNIILPVNFKLLGTKEK